MNQQLRTKHPASSLLIATLVLVAAACSSGTTSGPSGPPEDTLVLCSDGIDNDGNGLIDCLDPNCANSTDKKIQAHCAKGDTAIGDGKGDADTTLTDGTGTDKDGIDLDETGTGDGNTADTEVATSTCPLAGGFGCPCTTASDCDSGYCVDGDQGKICTQTCSDNCPADWVCKQTNGTDASWICLPAFPSLCMPCANSDECQVNGMTGSLCVPFVRSDEGQGHGFVDGSFCLAPCAPDPKGGAGLCKTGYKCKVLTLSATSKPVSMCTPDSGDCACHDNWAQAGKSTICTKSSVAGTCTSKRQCGVNATGQTVLSVCDAPQPATEVCGDNVDNDCNGLTDEPGAAGCKDWYPDNDKDGYGTGLPTCTCNDLGQGYSNMGGDCNDLSTSIHPGAVEICNNIDDNCNGVTDESGSKGCTVFFHDLDGDGWGNPNDSACLCKSKQTSDWITQGGDCDDTPGSGAKINPTVQEVCDGVDNNCNGKTDEEGAVGCKLYYVDADNDTFGLLTQGKCLCAATKVYSAGQPGDCDDSAHRQGALLRA